MFIKMILCLSVFVFGAEFLVYDGVRTFEEKDNGFHYYCYLGKDPVPDTWPKDWTTPDDYRNMTWEVRFEVFSTASSHEFTWQLCIWQDMYKKNIEFREQCSNPYTTVKGPDTLFTTTNPFTAWYQKGNGKFGVDLTRPLEFTRLGIVLRKPDGCYLSPYESLDPRCWEERDKYYPTKFRITVVAVSEGSEFSGWGKYIKD